VKVHFHFPRDGRATSGLIPRPWGRKKGLPLSGTLGFIPVITRKRGEEKKGGTGFQLGYTGEIEDPPTAFLYNSFGGLVEEFNSLVPDDREKIEPWVKNLRNLLAHGIVWSRNPSMEPMEFYKFRAQGKKGKERLFQEESFELTESWLNENIKKTISEEKRIHTLYEKLGS